MSPGTGASHSRCYRLWHWPDQDSNTLDINPWVLARQQGPAALSTVNDTGPLEGLWKGLEFRAQLLPIPIQGLRFHSLSSLGMPTHVTKACHYNGDPENEMSYSRN